MNHFSVSSTIKTYPRRLPFIEMKEAILGKSYELSLVFIGPDRARRLNEENRQKTYIPNVLSFPLSNSAGEIFICPHVAKREAKNFNLSERGYIAYLFIHGCVHLKGYDHGATMERLERKYLKAFNIS